MKHTLEIVPGKSIGPFRLGMTLQEIEEALRSLSPDAPTLEDLGIRTDFPKEDTPDNQKRCNRLEIRVVNNDHTLLLHGQPVNDISNSDADSLFSSISPDVPPLLRLLVSGGSRDRSNPLGTLRRLDLLLLRHTTSRSQQGCACPGLRIRAELTRGTQQPLPSQEPT